MTRSQLPIRCETDKCLNAQNCRKPATCSLRRFLDECDDRYATKPQVTPTTGGPTDG